jgi:DNA-binding transcriptional LysR family regulator
MQELLCRGVQDFLPGTGGHEQNVELIAKKITVTQIRSLIAVSENISFVQAAQSIGVSPAAVQRAARALENLLRKKLYFHDARGTKATKEGAQLARHLKLAISEISYAVDEINAQMGTINSTILIGTLSAVGAPLLARAVDRLLSMHPALTVKVIEEPYEHLLNDLLLGNIDFLFSVLRQPAWAMDEVTEERLYWDDYVVAARRGHPLCGVRTIKRDTLIDFDWVVPGPATPRFQAFLSLFKHNRMPPAHVITTSRTFTRSLITTSNRLTLLTRHEAESEQMMGVMAVLPIDCNIPAPAYGVATRKNWAPPSIQKQFLEILRALANDDGSARTAAERRRIGGNPIADPKDRSRAAEGVL